MVVKETSVSFASSLIASGGIGGCSGFQRMPPGIAASKRASAMSPPRMCSITQRRAPGARKGTQICFSVEAGMGENDAAIASEGVGPSKPRLPAAETEPFAVASVKLLMVTRRDRMSATPLRPILSATRGFSLESRGDRIAPSDSKLNA